MTLVLLREFIGKYMTESYRIMPVFMRKINGKYVTERCPNFFNIYEEISGKYGIRKRYAVACKAFALTISCF